MNTNMAEWNGTEWVEKTYYIIVCYSRWTGKCWRDLSKYYDTWAEAKSRCVDLDNEPGSIDHWPAEYIGV